VTEEQAARPAFCRLADRARGKKFLSTLYPCRGWNIFGKVHPQGVLALVEQRRWTSIGLDVKSFKRIVALRCSHRSGKHGKQYCGHAIGSAIDAVLLGKGCSTCIMKGYPCNGRFNSAPSDPGNISLIHNFRNLNRTVFSLLATALDGKSFRPGIFIPAKSMLILGSEAHGVSERFFLWRMRPYDPLIRQSRITQCRHRMRNYHRSMADTERLNIDLIRNPPVERLLRIFLKLSNYHLSFYVCSAEKSRENVESIESWWRCSVRLSKLDFVPDPQAGFLYAQGRFRLMRDYVRIPTVGRSCSGLDYGWWEKAFPKEFCYVLFHKQAGMLQRVGWTRQKNHYDILDPSCGI